MKAKGLLIYGVVVGLLLTLGLSAGFQMRDAWNTEPPYRNYLDKFREVMQHLHDAYYQEIDEDQLIENALQGMLHELDPHTFYISAQELASINERMRGNYEGIGVEFVLIDDTVHVVWPIPGGPGAEAGLRPGDRIVEVEGQPFAGTGLTHSRVIERLRGPKGSEVQVTVFRGMPAQPRSLRLHRDRIPIESIDYAFMVDARTGYIRVNRFAEKTLDEFADHLHRLQARGMKRLILDLRDNPGGYLEMAQEMADLFLSQDKLILYTEGRTRRSQETYFASRRLDDFETGGLVILINEGSASASEIVAGAVQDWDRGLVMGSRSFGKGLVQHQHRLRDGSAIRVVVSRYYTPSGRCIQRPFDAGEEAYYNEVRRRQESGESYAEALAQFPDSLRWQTYGGRTVYGGGGILPDIYLAADTSYRTDYLDALNQAQLLDAFTLRYARQHAEIRDWYADGEAYARSFQPDSTLMTAFAAYAASRGVRPSPEDQARTADYLRTQLKARMGRIWYGDAGFYPSLLLADTLFRRAIEEMPRAELLAREHLSLTEKAAPDKAHWKK